MESLAVGLLIIGFCGVSVFSVVDSACFAFSTFLVVGEGLFSLIVFLGLELLFAFLREPSGNGRKSMGAVRTFFFLALVSKNRAPLVQLPPVNAGFLKLYKRCPLCLGRKVLVLLYDKAIA